MKEQKKKRIIATLLFVSCFISGYMLFATSGGESNRLRNLSQVDSLIHQELTEFNIGEQQIRISTTRIDSNFSRKNYRIALPYRFSKTQLHASLNRTFHGYSVEAPARVTFPEQNVDIYLSYHGTVVRTISLQTDPELTLNQNYVSILIAFDYPPNEELTNRLARLGEPIPMVFKIENPMQANELNKKLSSSYDHIIFWLQNNYGEDILASNSGSVIAKFKQLETILPEAKVLQLQGDKEVRQQLIAETNLSVVNAANTLLLDEGAGKATFFEKFHKLESNPAYSMAVIAGNETTLTWFQEKLPELKKAGIRLTLPSQINY